MTETFNFAITYVNGVFEVSQPSNGNYVLGVPLANGILNTHPSVANYYYIGNQGYAILLDYTLCTNLTTASRKAQMDAILALAAAPPVSGTVAVSNFPAVQTVSVNNFPATQQVSGTVAVTQSTSPWVTSVSNFPASQSVTQGTTPWVTSTSATIPAAADLVGASRTTTGTLYTVPAGRTFLGTVSLSCSISVAGNCQPSISVSGTGALPSGTLHQIICVGLALVAVANSNTQNTVYIYGGTGGATVTFTAGASGTSTGQITGHLL